MKYTSKFLAILLALCMVLSLGVTAFASGEPSAEPAGVPVEEAFLEYLHEFLLAEQEINSNMTLEQVETEFMPAFEAAAKTGDWLTNTLNGAPLDILFNGMLEQGAAMTFEEFAAQYDGGASDTDDPAWPAYVEYLHDYLVNVELPVNTGGLTMEIIEEEFMPLIEVGNFEDGPTGLLFNGLLDSGVAMTFEEFKAAGGASGEALSVEDAFLEYLHEFLLAEQEINSNMTLEQVETEFMPAFEAAAQTGDWLTNTVNGAPLDILFNGMLEQGAAMTFEEFAAQYVPAGAGGDTSVEAWHAYLKEYVDAVPAVDDEAFQVFSALIDADDFTTPPGDMLFNAQWWGYAAMTYDEFVAAGGAYEIPNFDPNLVPD